MGIGYRIKEAREKLGLTQTELGKKIGVTGSAITNYENNISHPKEPILYKLFEALDVDPNYLFQDEIEIKDKERVLSLKDKILLKKYNNLNQLGQSKADAYIDDLSGNPLYCQTYSFNVAAFGGASKTGELTKDTVNQLVDELDDLID